MDFNIDAAVNLLMTPSVIEAIVKGSVGALAGEATKKLWGNILNVFNPLVKKGSEEQKDELKGLFESNSDAFESEEFQAFLTTLSNELKKLQPSDINNSFKDIKGSVVVVGDNSQVTISNNKGNQKKN
jgi:hypothetical protein